MILPLFTYCAFSLYGATPQYIKSRISNLESRAQRIIGAPIPKREEILKKKMCLFVHRCINKNNVPNTFEDYFKFKNTTMSARSNGNKLEMPRIKLEAARATFKYQGINLFNSLSKDVRIETDFNRFKQLI